MRFKAVTTVDVDDFMSTCLMILKKSILFLTMVNEEVELAPSW